MELFLHAGLGMPAATWQPLLHAVEAAGGAPCSVVLGHSLGARPALRTARRRRLPLVLLAPATAATLVAPLPALLRAVWAVPDWLLLLVVPVVWLLCWLREARGRETFASFAARHRPDTGDLRGWLCRLRRQASGPLLRELRLPSDQRALVIFGARDPLLTITCPAFHGDGLERCVLPGAGHLLHETHPGPVWVVIMRWLEGRGI